jgi:hypothetical protein
MGVVIRLLLVVVVFLLLGTAVRSLPDANRYMKMPGT